ncbi:hypothetical protein [Enterobacter kobei]|nr:hypothetical protein [Enterobacter kobei]
MSQLSFASFFDQAREAAPLTPAIPASRPAPATEAVKTADNKKEGDHE